MTPAQRREALIVFFTAAGLLFVLWFGALLMVSA